MEEENKSCDDDDDHQIGILIPQDVLIQILVFLPVISLLRFKSVCKSWRALFQSSLFINLHLNTTNNNNNKNNVGTFIYQTSDYSLPGEKKSEAFMLSSSSSAAAGGGDDEEELLKWEDLEFPPRYKFSPETYIDDIFMVGSCNGLICIHDTTKKNEVSLWNPATRQFRLLPKSLTFEAEIPGDIEQDYVAFGYDVKTKDYKVLLISHFRPYNNPVSSGLGGYHCVSVVQVYSLSTDSWRVLEPAGINYLPAIPVQTNRWYNGVYLKNGSYYFLGLYYIDSEPSFMLISFDFAKMIFTTTLLPSYYHPTSFVEKQLVVHLTSLAEKQLVVYVWSLVKEDESDFVTYDIWVLNEHHGGGVKEEEEPWTKLHSINLNYTGIPTSISNNGVFALMYTEDDRVINDVHVSNCRLLQLFNLVTHEVKKEFRTSPVIRAVVYNQSLVSIGGNDVQQPIGDWC